ncbi:unnamed protein product [Lathyrus oleraceus]
MAIDPSKDDDQFGWRNWGGWSSIGRRGNSGGVAKGKGEHTKKEKDNKSSRHIGGDWDLRGTRSWGH